MDKEDVVHIYNGILLSHKKEQNWVICRDMDGPRDLQSEVSQKEKNKYRILTHISGIWKNWYRRSYLQSRNRDTDLEIENKCMDMERGGGMNKEIGNDIYTLLILCVK